MSPEELLDHSNLYPDGCECDPQERCTYCKTLDLMKQAYNACLLDIKFDINEHIYSDVEPQSLESAVKDFAYKLLSNIDYYEYKDVE